jgi:hypothetical protein
MKFERFWSRRRNVPRAVLVSLAALLVSSVLTGCVAVGYSSTGGWFIWPGGLGLLVVILVVVLLLRRR